MNVTVSKKTLFYHLPRVNTNNHNINIIKSIQFNLFPLDVRTWLKIIISIYSLSDLGVSSNLIGSLSRSNKHLMTGPKGNSEFCFPEISMFPEGKPRGTLRLEGKQNSLFPEGPVIKCFVIPPNFEIV